MATAIDQLLSAAQSHAQAGRLREAAGACAQVLSVQPRHPLALFLMGFLLHQVGQWQLALQRLTLATEVHPKGAEAHFLIGLIHQQQQNLPAAIAAYQRAILFSPKHPKSLNNLGRALLDTGRIDEGIAMLRRAVAADPKNAGAFSNLGDGLRISGDLTAAAAMQRRAIAIDPNPAESHSNLGVALAQQGHIADAIASMLRAVAINPQLATPHYNLARLYQDQNRTDEAIAHCRTALELRPRYGDALNLLGNLMGTTGDIAQAIASHQSAVEVRPDWASTHSNLLLSLHYLGDQTPEQIFQAHLDWAARHGGSPRAVLGPREPVAGRRLRIGFLSPNFSSHSVSHFVEPVLAGIDRNRFEVFCYADLRAADETTAHLRSLVEHWQEITNQKDPQVIERLVRDRLDILVDLAGHTGDNRMRVFAAKPAPVQVTWLGYPDTTGLAAMDYRITDAIADPPGVSDQLHTEKLIRIEGGCWAYRAPPDAPPVAPTPMIANGFVTFGSFNNLAKVTPTVLETWARILHALPGSRLVMKALGLSSQAGRERIGRQLTAAGIGADRVELLSWSLTTSSHLELYHRIDLALDTFPYNGTTTTCEALWMGVPVIGFPGRTHAARVGASLLTHAGLPELLADDVEGYVTKAIAFAGDTSGLTRLRSDLRARFAASPVCDGGRLCRALEKALSSIL